MSLRSTLGVLVCAAAVPQGPAVRAPAPALRAQLAPAEEKAVEAYLQVLRGCCMGDGAINMVDHGPGPSAPVWAAPYFADHVALALLAASDHKRNADDVTRVGRWIAWRLARQEPGGFWYDYTGTAAKYASNNKVDAHDSSAALFLLVLERYQRGGGHITPAMVAAAKNSLKCVASVTDADGLTWARPDYRVKYLMDNIEVYAGLKAAGALFSKTKDAPEAKDCGARAAAIGKRLPDYFGAKDKERFAWALHPGGAYDGGMDKLYPHGLAQLFGAAFVRPGADAFGDVVRKFAPETGPAATGAERFLIAASRAGGKAAADWRATVVKDDSLRAAKSTYSYRPALAVLALLEGADWMPSLLN